MKRWGPLKSTPPSTRAALMWPWYLLTSQQHWTLEPEGKDSTVSNTNSFCVAHPNKWDFSIVMAVTTLESLPVA